MNIKRLFFGALLFMAGQVFASATFSSEVAGARCDAVNAGYQITGWTSTLTGFALTAEMDIPATGEAYLFSWIGVSEKEEEKDVSHRIFFTVTDGYLRGYWCDAGVEASINQFPDGEAFQVEPGRRTVMVRYGRTANVPDAGVSVWIDGACVYRQSGLRFSAERTTGIHVGDGAIAVENITLEDAWQVPLTCSEPLATIVWPSDAEVLCDGTLQLANEPIKIEIPTDTLPCTSFSVELLAQLPQGKSGALIGGQVKQQKQDSQQIDFHTVQIEVVNGSGYNIRHNDNQVVESTEILGLTTDTLWNAFSLSYSDQETHYRGTRLLVNGEPAVKAPGVVWTGAPLTKITIGNDATGEPSRPLTGLRIRRAVVTLKQAAIAEDPWGTLCDLPASLSGFSNVAKHQVYNQLMSERGELALGDISVGGEAASTLDAVRVAMCLGLSAGEGADLDFNVADFAIDEQGVALQVASSHNQVAGTLALLARNTLSDPWSRVAVYSAPFSFEEENVTLLYDVTEGQAHRFFKVRMEQEAKELGEIYTFWNAPADCDPFPSMPLTTSNTLTFTSRLIDEEFLETAADALEIVFEGEALCSGMQVTLSDGAQSWTATLQEVETYAQSAKTATGLPRGRVVFMDAKPPTVLGTTLTLTVTGHSHGGLTIVECSWGGAFEGQHRRIAAQLATDLVADGFVEQQYVDNRTWTPEDRSSTNDNQLFYRIPAMATDGNGLIHVAYDVRYGGGDLGDQRLSGLDLGGNISTDGGRTWSKPFHAVDVPNFRNPDGSWPYGKNRDNITRALDIGDAAMLYDPKTETFWLMAITGGGLLSYGGTGSPRSDCVLYMRTKQDTEWKAWTGGTEAEHPRSVKKMLVNALGRDSVTPGILQGPGHGTVTQIGGEGMPVGTLIFPMQGFVNGATSNAQCFAAYSTDNGKTWQTTGLTPHTSSDTNAQENSIVELDDGSWLMMCKGGSWGAGKGRRLFYRTTDYNTWKQLASDTGIIHVQGSILRIGTHADGGGRYVKCHQIDPNERAKLTLIFGRDLTSTNTTADSEGIAWDCGSLEVYHEATNAQGYNTLCMIDGQTLGVCYESQGIIWFERIDISGYLR